jgi:hypothetical protein
MGFRRTSGRSAASRLAVGLAALAFVGCNYGLRGGGRFPDHVRTVYIQAFENTTDRFELDQQLFRQLTEQLPRSLGLRLGSEENADAVIRGRIVRYSDAARNYTASQGGNVDVLQHQVEITIAVEIVDLTQNLILWDSQSLSGRGEYRPDSQSDEIARAQALESLIRQIVDGAQSQW